MTGILGASIGGLHMAIFSYNSDINKNAYLNWNTDKRDKIHNFHVLAKDFEEAAITMLEAVLNENRDKKADRLIMPIFYCIDQSIEVYLKAAISLLNELMEINEKVPNSHDIRFLYETMKSRIEKKEKSTKGLQKHLSALKDYIDELYKYIKPSENSKPNMDFARYPVDTKGNPHFYIESSDNVVVNVEELNKVFNKVVCSLEGIYLMYDEELENENERTNIR